jgi:predicted ATPase/DNA-binding CsgD family transcriptional regulator
MFDSSTSTASILSGAALVPAKPPAIGAFVPPSSFVGREQESADVKRLLANTRLLTLTGPGGVGKTRLALEVSRDVDGGAMFADGVWFTGLAPLSDPTLVPHATAAALGIREQPGYPMLETIQEAVRDRHLLLVLDNCEHLVEACAQVADTLLRGCPGLTILATSREPLRITGETAWSVPPLSIPTRSETPNLDALLACEAIQLFVQRAQSTAPAFALTEQNASAVADICARLDGIPLAIELAAARVRLLAPAQIAARLSDRFRLLTGGARTALPRHQTIRALVDWSYELLPEPERTLFSRLGVFAGDWSLEAAEAVGGGDGIEPSAVVDLLGNLVDKSLVVAQPTAPDPGQVRYRLLETLREYALERLTIAGNTDAAMGRHALYFLALAERADKQYWGGDEARALSTIESDHDNVRAALRHFLASGDGESAARLAGGLSMFWFIRGHCSEGRTWLREVLELVESAGPLGNASATYANVLQADARLAHVQCDHVAAEQRLRAALPIWRRVGDHVKLANTLFLLGRVELLRGQPAVAMPLLEEGLGYAERAGHHSMETLIRLWLGQVAFEDGDDDTTRMQAGLVLGGGDAAGSPRDACFALQLLGKVEARLGRSDQAHKLFEASLAYGREVGRWLAAWPAIDLADLLIEQRDYVTPRALLREALTTYRDAGDRQGVARGLEACARLAAAADVAAQAVRLAGAAAALRSAAQTPMSPPERIALERHLPVARASLGARGASIAWTEGQSLPAAQAVAQALAFLEYSEPAADGPAPVRTGPLTPREREVAALVEGGLSNRAIAAALVITEATTERHIRNIFDKLGLTSRAQLAVWAHEHGLSPEHPG